MHVYDQQVSEIISQAEEYHKAYYAVKTFRGPSLYFHRRALQSDADFTHRLEYIYATLTAWGMHRMGRGGSKMLSFEKFQSSALQLQDQIVEATRIMPGKMSEADWRKIEQIFKGITVMETRTRLVGNSKVMAHLLPSIVPPIDREYTLRYLRRNTNIVNDIDKEWQLMKGIIAEFFIPVSMDNTFQTTAKRWLADQDNYPWDTSTFKIIDNLVIGVRKQRLSGPAEDNESENGPRGSRMQTQW